MVGTKGVGSQPFATLRWETDFESVFQVIQGILGRGTPWWSSRPPGWGDAGTGSFHIYRTWSLWWGDCKVPVKSSSFWTRRFCALGNLSNAITLVEVITLDMYRSNWECDELNFTFHTRSIELEDCSGKHWSADGLCWVPQRMDDLESLDALTPVEVMTWRRIVPIGDCYELNFQDNWELYGMEITWSLSYYARNLLCSYTGSLTNAGERTFEVLWILRHLDWIGIILL